MKLTDAQSEKLEWLHKQGGSGYLDKHGRMVAGGDHMPQGCWPAWLNLVAHGLISGGDGRLTITDYGRRHMAPSGEQERTCSDAMEDDGGSRAGSCDY